MTSKDFTVREVERVLLNIPFHPRCAAVKELRVPGWSLVELCMVTTSSGVVGIGETITNYTWGRTDDRSANRAIGQNVFDLLWDDGLGAGLQMALFDAAGKLLGVPCNRLMGPQHRDACPVSWWAQDMTPEAWAAEARAAEAEGFACMKVKARPWFDPDRQLEVVCAAVSPHFKLDTDYNSTLLGVDIAAPLLSKLEQKHANLAIVETPIPQNDVAGNAALRRKIRSPIAMHIGVPPVMTAIREGVCDGFVIGGGASRVMKDGILAEKAQMPFWLQMVGTGLTTTFSLHLGSVLAQARWPAIPCVNIYSHPVTKRFTVEGGLARVPEEPGLGVELDNDAVERYRVEPDFTKPEIRQIHTIRWPDGRQTHYPGGSYRQLFLDGKIPGFLPGIYLDARLDDGSDEFDREHRELFGAKT